MILKRILSLIIILNLMMPPPYALSDANEDKLLAVKRAYHRKTGLYWDDASPDSQQKFMRQFEQAERARMKIERARKHRLAREKRAKLREKLNDQRLLDRLEREYLRR